MNPPAPVTRTRRFFHVDVVLNFLLPDQPLQAGVCPHTQNPMTAPTVFFRLILWKKLWKITLQFSEIYCLPAAICTARLNLSSKLLIILNL